MQKRTIYFAHPINTYAINGSPIEEVLLAHIANKWKGDTIINPGDAKHEAVCKKIKEHDPNANVMGYFTELVKTCDEVVVLPFLDGKWGKGVYAEAEAVLDLKKGKYVWVFDHNTLFGKDAPTIKFVPKLDPALCLSVEETRARIRNPDRTIRPYA